MHFECISFPSIINCKTRYEPQNRMCYGGIILKYLKNKPKCNFQEQVEYKMANNGKTINWLVACLVSHLINGVLSTVYGGRTSLHHSIITIHLRFSIKSSSCSFRVIELYSIETSHLAQLVQADQLPNWARPTSLHLVHFAAILSSSCTCPSIFEMSWLYTSLPLPLTANSVCGPYSVKVLLVRTFLNLSLSP